MHRAIAGEHREGTEVFRAREELPFQLGTDLRIATADPVGDALAQCSEFCREAQVPRGALLAMAASEPVMARFPPAGWTIRPGRNILCCRPSVPDVSFNCGSAASASVQFAATQ